MGESMGVSTEFRQKAARIWEMERQHPFILGIGNGTLPTDRFRYYMRQDYVYLVEFCRAVAAAVTKAQAVDDMAWFARLLHETLNTEMSLHIGYCRDFGITEEELRSTRPSPTTLAYTRHLLESAYSGGAGDIAAAVLPCGWGYSEIGQTLQEKGLPVDQPLYCRWIKMYSSPEFAALAGWLRSFVDRYALRVGETALRKMEELFLTSSRYEFMFWDAAYRMEEWPV